MSGNKKKLLNITNKNSRDLARQLKHGDLVQHPYYRGISRLSYKPDFFSHRLEAEFLPDLVQDKRTPMSWKDCCFARAQSIFQQTSNKVYLSWSGGIDSTTALLSLLEVASPEDRARLVIVLSHHSILENPSIYEKYVSKLPQHNILRDLSDELIAEKSLFVTGELGDQLFGSDILMAACEKYGDSILHAPYQDAVPKIIETDSIMGGSGRRMFERLHPIVEECPFPIRSSHDFFWWWNFSQKWQHVKFRIYHLTSWNINATYGQHAQHFFDTVDFQIWSLNNHDLKIQDTWDSYKIEAKQFLATITKDPQQLALPKSQSLEKTYLVSENRIAITEDMQTVATNEDLLTYAITE